MRRYEERQQKVTVLAGVSCDGCGKPVPDYGVTVEIAVNDGEEGGSRDVYDYCDPCLVARADALKAAGSRAPLVTGEWDD